jgi:hypothetical protein
MGWYTNPPFNIIKSQLLGIQLTGKSLRKWKALQNHNRLKYGVRSGCSKKKMPEHVPHFSLYPVSPLYKEVTRIT